MWDELQRAVRKPKRKPLTSTDADLDAFEVQRGVKLPLSYRDFAKSFGRCEMTGINGDISIAAPVRDKDRKSRYDLAALDATQKKVIEGDDDVFRINPEIGANMVFFAFDNDYSYGWNTSELTSPETHDYAVYVRGTESYDRVASLFEEFVMTYALGEDLKAWRRWIADGGEGMSGGGDHDEDQDLRIFLDPM